MPATPTPAIADWHKFPDETPPENNKHYLVTANDVLYGTCVTVDFWSDLYNGFLQYRKHEVLAWAVLPSPFEEAPCSGK